MRSRRLDAIAEVRRSRDHASASDHCLVRWGGSLEGRAKAAYRERKKIDLHGSELRGGPSPVAHPRPHVPSRRDGFPKPPTGRTPCVFAFVEVARNR
jgi:hypothetical protein